MSGEFGSGVWSTTGGEPRRSRALGGSSPLARELQGRYPAIWAASTGKPGRAEPIDPTELAKSIITFYAFPFQKHILVESVFLH